jgi:hypothetical protein
MSIDDIRPFRLTGANWEAMEAGVRVDFVRFAKGHDGVYELYLEGHGDPPLPDHSTEPPVRLAK